MDRIINDSISDLDEDIIVNENIFDSDINIEFGDNDNIKLENINIDIKKKKCCDGLDGLAVNSEDEIELSNEDFSQIKKILNNDINNKKKTFENHIQIKLCKINKRLRYANHKYNDVRSQFNSFSITIIVLSFILTLLEAFKNTIDCEDLKPEIVKNTINFLPLILSTMVSFFTALIKFNKYEDKIESLVKANEKGIYTISEMKQIRESLYFCGEDIECIKNLMIEFEKTVYPKYLSNNCDIEKELNDHDYIKYIQEVNSLDIIHAEINNIKEEMLLKIDKGEDVDELHQRLEKYKYQEYKCKQCFPCLRC